MLEVWKNNFAPGLQIAIPKITDFRARVMHSVITRMEIPLEFGGKALGSDELIAIHLLAFEIPNEVIHPNDGKLTGFLNRQAKEYIEYGLGDPQVILGFLMKTLIELKAQQINVLPTTASQQELAA